MADQSDTRSIHAFQKIVWAVDAFDATGPLYERTCETLRGLAQNAGATVHPVYVLSPGQLNLSVEFNSPLIFEYRPAAERALNDLVSRCGIPNLARPHIISHNTTSTNQAVDALVSYAREIDADLIVTDTHGRSGFTRLLLGSFSETLLMRAKTPVMTIGPDARAFHGVRRILMPTEFGEHSKAIFEQAIAFALEIGAAIRVYHAIPHPIEPMFQSGVYLLGGSWIPVQTYFNEEIARQTRRGEAWARFARSRGVDCSFTLETEARQVSELILEAARAGSLTDLIIMEGRTGSLAAALLGSVTRQVIRHAPCPVWVLRSDQLGRDLGKTGRAA